MKTFSRTWTAIALASLLFLGACKKRSEEWESCASADDCQGELACMRKVCVDPAWEKMSGAEQCNASCDNYVKVFCEETDANDKTTDCNDEIRGNLKGRCVKSCPKRDNRTLACMAKAPDHDAWQTCLNEGKKRKGQ